MRTIRNGWRAAVVCLFALSGLPEEARSETLCVNKATKVVTARRKCRSNEKNFSPLALKGAQGDVGPQGPQGPQGPKGNQGEAGILNLQSCHVVAGTLTPNASGVGSRTLTCPLGEFMLTDSSNNSSSTGAEIYIYSRTVSWAVSQMGDGIVPVGMRLVTGSHVSPEYTVTMQILCCAQ